MKRLLRKTLRLLPDRAKSRIRAIMEAEVLGFERCLIKERGAELIVSLDHILSHYLKTHRNVTFMQIGANDGITHDPISPLILKHSLQGVLVEPQAKIFRRLQSNYERFNGSNFVFINAAIAATDSILPLYRIKAEPSLPDWAQGLASFDKNVLLRHKFLFETSTDFDSLIEVEQVRAISFPTLYREFSIPRIDLLQIDVEGYDAEVLRQFDVPNRKPAIVQFEHKHLNRDELNFCLNMLIDQGYQVAICGIDTLAYNSNY